MGDFLSLISYDGFGQVLTVKDALDRVVTYEYNAQGDVTKVINEAVWPGTWSGPFGNAGRFGYQEDATGLKLLGHRYYDSSTGRFLTRDPIKDGRNWYVYCENTPLALVDPTGYSGQPRRQAHAMLADEGDPADFPTGISPYDDPNIKPKPYVDDGDDNTWWDDWVSTLGGTIAEEAVGNPIPIDAVGAPLGVPYKGLDRRRQQEQQLIDDPYGSGSTLTWEQDPEYHEAEYIPTWRK